MIRMELLAVKLFVAFRFKVKLLRSCFLSRANILRWTKMLQVWSSYHPSRSPSHSGTQVLCFLKAFPRFANTLK